jgi:hypothetical protein
MWSIIVLVSSLVLPYPCNLGVGSYLIQLIGALRRVRANAGYTDTCHAIIPTVICVLCVLL